MLVDIEERVDFQCIILWEVLSPSLWSGVVFMCYEMFNMFRLPPDQGQQVQSKLTTIFLMCTTFLSAGKVALKSLNLSWWKVSIWAARYFQAFQGNNNSFELLNCGSTLHQSFLTSAVNTRSLKLELCCLTVTGDTLAREILPLNFYY